MGSYASTSYGEPRFTQDIDVLVALDHEQVGALCDAFPPPDCYVSRDAAEAAVRRRGQFNVIHPASGTKVDFMVARSEGWHQADMKGRRRVRILPDAEGLMVRPEDVIIGKLRHYKQGANTSTTLLDNGVAAVNAPFLMASCDWAAAAWSRRVSGRGHGDTSGRGS